MDWARCQERGSGCECAGATEHSKVGTGAGIEANSRKVGNFDSGRPEDAVVAVDDQGQAIAVKAWYVAALQEAAKIHVVALPERPEAVAAAPLSDRPG